MACVRFLTFSHFDRTPEIVRGGGSWTIHPLWRAGEDLGATFSRCSQREFYRSLAYVRSPHGPLKYAGGCNGD